MKKSVFFIICLFLFVFRAAAQNILTFDECLEIAFKENLSIKEALLTENLSEIQYNLNRSTLLPSINSSMSNNYSYGRSIDPYSNTFINTQFKSYSGNIVANVVLFSGFEKINRIKLAKQEIELDKSISQKVKNDITIDIASNYITILYLEELIKANQEQIKISKDQLKILQIKFTEGYIAESDVFKMQSQIANEEFNLVSNENLLDMHYLNLKQIMNFPRDREMRLSSLLKVNYEILSSEDDFFIEEYIRNQPSYQIVKLQEEQSKTNIAISKAAFLPTLNLVSNFGSLYSNSNPFYNFKDQLNNNTNYGFGLSLSIPIFNGFSVRYRVKSAEVTYEQSIIRSELEKNNLARILQQAFKDLKAITKKVEAVETSYAFLKKSLEAEQVKLEYGKISQTELLITKNNYNNTEAELIKTKYEYLYQFGLIGFYKNNFFEF